MLKRLEQVPANGSRRQRIFPWTSPKVWTRVILRLYRISHGVRCKTSRAIDYTALVVNVLNWWDEDLGKGPGFIADILGHWVRCLFVPFGS